MITNNYDKAYSLGFQQGFLSAMNMKATSEDHTEGSVTKKNIREGSYCDASTKLKKERKKNPQQKSFMEQKKAAREWALTMGYITK